MHRPARGIERDASVELGRCNECCHCKLVGSLDDEPSEAKLPVPGSHSAQHPFTMQQQTASAAVPGSLEVRLKATTAIMRVSCSSTRKTLAAHHIIPSHPACWHVSGLSRVTSDQQHRLAFFSENQQRNKNVATLPLRNGHPRKPEGSRSPGAMPPCPLHLHRAHRTCWPSNQKGEHARHQPV